MKEKTRLELTNDYIIEEQEFQYKLLVPYGELPSKIVKRIKRLKHGFYIFGNLVEDCYLSIETDLENNDYIVITPKAVNSGTAKLDTYDYEIIWLHCTLYNIKINVEGNTDVSIADIASDITSHDGYIYVEGRYFTMNEMQTVKEADGTVTLNIYAMEENV